MTDPSIWAELSWTYLENSLLLKFEPSPSLWCMFGPECELVWCELRPSPEPGVWVSREMLDVFKFETFCPIVAGIVWGSAGPLLRFDCWFSWLRLDKGLVAAVFGLATAERHCPVTSKLEWRRMKEDGMSCVVGWWCWAASVETPHNNRNFFL